MPQFYLSMWYLNLIVPLKIRFGFVSGKFDRAIVRILARLKIPMARPNGPHMPPKVRNSAK